MILIVAAVLPAILLWLYTCKKDAQPEPMSQMRKNARQKILAQVERDRRDHQSDEITI